MKVSAADPAVGDLDEHLSRARDGYGHLLDLDPAVADVDRSRHRLELVNWCSHSPVISSLIDDERGKSCYLVVERSRRTVELLSVPVDVSGAPHGGLGRDGFDQFARYPASS